MQEQTPAPSAIQPVATPNTLAKPVSQWEQDRTLVKDLLVAGAHSQDGRARMMEALGVNTVVEGWAGVEAVLSRLLANASVPFALGQSYFIRTVTSYFTGRLVAVTQDFLVLEDMAWIADTGRLADFLERGADDNLQVEIEPYPNGVQPLVARGGIIDMMPWKHPLPRTQRSGKKSSQK